MEEHSPGIYFLPHLVSKKLVLCQCMIYIHTALKDSMFLKCCIPSLLVKILIFQVPRTFCPENIELTAATPLCRYPNGEDLHYHEFSHFHSVCTPPPPPPEKLRNLRKFFNYIARLSMQPGVQNAINHVAKIKYLFVPN